MCANIVLMLVVVWDFFFECFPIRFTARTRPKMCTDQQMSLIANFIVAWVEICLKSLRLKASS